MFIAWCKFSVNLETTVWGEVFASAIAFKAAWHALRVLGPVLHAARKMRLTYLQNTYMLCAVKRLGCTLEPDR